MNLLYLLTQPPGQTLEKIIELERTEHTVTVIDLRENKNYEQIADRIFSSDSVISW